jgi:hypothetical protein
MKSGNISLSMIDIFYFSLFKINMHFMNTVFSLLQYLSFHCSLLWLRLTWVALQPLFDVFLMIYYCLLRSNGCSFHDRSCFNHNLLMLLPLLKKLITFWLNISLKAYLFMHSLLYIFNWSGCHIHIWLKFDGMALQFDLCLGNRLILVSINLFILFELLLFQDDWG